MTSPPPSLSSPLPFTAALRSLNSPLWAEVGAICHQLPPSSPFLSSHPHPYSYQSDLRVALETLDPAFLPTGEVKHAISALDQASEQLTSIEEDLDYIINSLEERDSELEGSKTEIADLRTELETHSVVIDHIGAFTELVELPPSLTVQVSEANPHSDEFKQALILLSSKIAFIELEANATSLACQDVGSKIKPLREEAVGRVVARLEHSLQLLREPSSTFDILRDTLLYKQSYLLEFVLDHGDGVAGKILADYISIAKEALLAKVEAYCDALSSWARLHLPPQNSFGLTTITKGTTNIFSAIFAETLSGPPLAADAVERGGAQRSRSSGPVMSVELASVKSQRKRVAAVLQRWTQASRAMTEPCLTSADIMMRQRESGPGVEEICQNGVAFFLDIVGRERCFLQGTFGDGAVTYLNDILDDCEKPILALFKLLMEGDFEYRNDVQGLLICLLLNRAHRSRIAAGGAHDARMSFLVQVEKLLQTRVLAEFDLQVGKLSELPSISTKSAVEEVQDAHLLLTLTALAADMFRVVMKGSSELQTADIVDIIHRRLLSFAKKLVKTIDLLGQQINDQVSRLRTKIWHTAVVLTVLEGPDNIVSLGDTFDRLREPILGLFSDTCTDYAKYVVEGNNVALSNAANAMRSERFDVAKFELTRFREKLEATVRAIRDSYFFLEDHNIISLPLHHIAIQAAITSLVDSNDLVSRLVQTHMPSESHLLMTKAVLETAFGTL